MNQKEFKKTLNNILQEYGFSREREAFYYFADEIITVIEIQKSNFENAFYINYGFLIKELWPEVEFPAERECDIRGRFQFGEINKKTYCFDYENSSAESLRKAIMEGIQKVVLPVINCGAIEYYNIFPEAKATLTLKTKKYLNMD